MKTIILEAEEDILDLLVYNFSQSHFETEGFEDIDDLIQNPPPAPIPLIIVGNTHPPDNQLDVCASLRNIPAFKDSILICLTTNADHCDQKKSF